MKNFPVQRPQGFRNESVCDINRFCLKKVKYEKFKEGYIFQSRFSLSKILACLALLAGHFGPYSPHQPHPHWCTTIREIFLQLQWINVIAPTWAGAPQWLKSTDYEFWMGIKISCRGFQSVCSPLNFKSVWIFGSGLEAGASACLSRIQGTLLHKSQWPSLDHGTRARLWDDLQAHSSWAHDLSGPRSIFLGLIFIDFSVGESADASLWLQDVLVHCCVLSCSIVSSSLRSHWLAAYRALCLWNRPGKNIGWVAMPTSKGYPNPGAEPHLLHHPH